VLDLIQDAINTYKKVTELKKSDKIFIKYLLYYNQAHAFTIAEELPKHKSQALKSLGVALAQGKKLLERLKPGEELGKPVNLGEIYYNMA
jgi:hypothetical protein